MQYGHGPGTDKSIITGSGDYGRKTGGNHSGLRTNDKCGTLRDVYIPCKSHSGFGYSSSFRSSHSPALRAGSGRNVDTHKAKGTGEQQALSYTGLQADVCLCGADQYNHAGTDKSNGGLT